MNFKKYMRCDKCESIYSSDGWKKLELVRTVTVKDEDPLLDRLIECRRCACGIVVAGTDDRNVEARGFKIPTYGGNWGIYERRKTDDGWDEGWSLGPGAFSESVCCYESPAEAKRRIFCIRPDTADVRRIVRRQDVQL